MFKNLRFSYKMMLMPGVVIIALVGLFVTTQGLDQRKSQLLHQVGADFVPAVEWAYQVERNLADLQRRLQDAVASTEQEDLEASDALAQEFLKLLERGRQFPPVISGDLQTWQTKFETYYAQTRKLSVYLIEGGTLSEEIVKELDAANTAYNAIREMTQDKIQQAKSQVSSSLAEVLQYNTWSIRLMRDVMIGCALVLAGLSFALIKTIMRPLRRVIAVANELARGNVEVSIAVESRDEIGTLAQVFTSLIETNRDLARAATAIGSGDYSVPINVRSADDVLGNALAQMKANLIASAQTLERQNWQKTGIADLNERLRGEKDVVDLAQQVINYLARYLDAQIGAICVVSDDHTLRMMGAYAYSERKGNHTVFKIGEGLIGQAALEKQPILFTNVPDDYIKITSELGERTPQYILVTPFLYEQTVQGVIELGAMQKFSEMQMEFLHQACESIAIAFHSAQARMRMKALLAETQRQSETLQVQQEELREANAGLEEQTRALRASEERLQVQQEELRQTNEELESQTRALERQKQELGQKNAELDTARHLLEDRAKDLEMANKYKSEFLANMSHELRTPLNSLLILSKLLAQNKDGNLTDKQVEFAQTIHTAGAELLELINEVLDLSKVEAGKVSLNLEHMKLNGLLKYVEQHFTHVVEKKGIALKIHMADGLPEAIYTDRQRVEQIIKNLLSNAIKFTSKGEVSVSIHWPDPNVVFTRQGLTPRQTIALTVTDTGIGIPQDKQALIFEAFQQVDGSISRKYGGTGLGLSIVREFTQLLGGEIQLKSVEGQGSSFTLYLPLTVSPTPSEEPALAARPQIAPKTQPLPGGQLPPPIAAETTLPRKSSVEDIRDDRLDIGSPSEKTLLIIEDDPHFAKILFDLARERGFKGLLAGDGAAGLQLAYQFLPSAILLDISLPGIDGWGVMKKLKDDPQTRHIPVHFISGQEPQLAAWKMGAIGYLSKPVTTDQLQGVFQSIEEAIARTIKRLLIVENDPVTQLSMQELLGGADVSITIANTGEEAYRMLQQAVFDCMVLDLGLEGMSGFELVEKIHEEAKISHLPIVIYTAKELTKEEEQQLKQYAESIVIKGVKSPERLLDEVTLFLHRVESALPEAQQQKLHVLHDHEAVFHQKTVLMVDDDIRNIFALSNVLEEKGMSVLVADNGKEALTMLTQHPEIELVLMDIMMPEMDGYEAIGQIRQQPQYRNLPIIALTAKAMKGDRQRCLEAGANDYLSKPVDSDKLLSLLRVWLY